MQPSFGTMPACFGHGRNESPVRRRSILGRDVKVPGPECTIIPPCPSWDWGTEGFCHRGGWQQHPTPCLPLSEQPPVQLSLPAWGPSLGVSYSRQIFESSGSCWNNIYPGMTVVGVSQASRAPGAHCFLCLLFLAVGCANTTSTQAAHRSSYLSCLDQSQSSTAVPLHMGTEPHHGPGCSARPVTLSRQGI